MRSYFLPTLTFSILLSTSQLAAFGFGDAVNLLSTTQNTTETKTVPESKSTLTNSLLSSLTSQLGVNDKQAAGGVGSILSYAKEELPQNKYTTLANAIPDASTLLSMAPQASSALGGLSALGGNASSLGDMASLASQFSSLGLDASMISKFVPVIMEYLKSSGSTDAMGILSGLFSK